MKSKLNISPELSNAIATVLYDSADTDKKFEIKISGNTASFGGVRLFATVGAAKAAITRQIPYARGDYRARYSQGEVLKNAYDIIAKQEGRNIDPKELTAYLIECGIITITEV